VGRGGADPVAGGEGEPTATWLLPPFVSVVLLTSVAAVNVLYALWAVKALALWLAIVLLAGNEPTGVAFVVPGGAERRTVGDPAATCLLLLFASVVLLAYAAAEGACPACRGPCL